MSFAALQLDEQLISWLQSTEDDVNSEVGLLWGVREVRSLANGLGFAALSRARGRPKAASRCWPSDAIQVRPVPGSTHQCRMLTPSATGMGSLDRALQVRAAPGGAGVPADDGVARGPPRSYLPMFLLVSSSSVYMVRH